LLFVLVPCYGHLLFWTEGAYVQPLFLFFSPCLRRQNEGNHTVSLSVQLAKCEPVNFPTRA
jgi:hypothetical protein